MNKLWLPPKINNFQMHVTFEGIFILVNDSHTENSLFSICVSMFGISNSTNDEKFWKSRISRCCISLGIKSFFNDNIFWNKIVTDWWCNLFKNNDFSKFPTFLEKKKKKSLFNCIKKSTMAHQALLDFVGKL